MRKINYIDASKWYEDFNANNLSSKEKRHAELSKIRQILTEGRDTKTYLDFCEKGKILSTELNEPYWYLYFEVSHKEGLTKSTPSRSECLDIAVRLYMESTKAKYKGCSQQTASYILLLNQYTLNDPLGHAESIQQGIDYCYQNLPLTPKWHLELLRVQTVLQIAREDWVSAENSAFEYQQFGENHPPTQLQSALYLCEIAYKQCDVNKLELHISAAERVQYKNIRFWQRAIILHWRSILVRMRGDAGARLRIQQDIQSTMRGGQSLPPELATVQFYDAIENQDWQLPDSMLSPIKFETSGVYYRSLAALRFIYAYRRATTRSQSNIIIPFVMLRLNHTSSLQRVINVITASVTYIGKMQNVSLLWKIIYVLMFIPYIPIFIIFSPLARILTNPEHDLHKFIKGVLKDSASLPIFEERLKRLETDPHYIP